MNVFMTILMYIIICSIVYFILNRKGCRLYTECLKSVKRFKIIIFLPVLFFMVYYLTFTNNYFIDRIFGYINQYTTYRQYSWRHIFTYGFEFGLPLLAKLASILYDSYFSYYLLISIIICLCIYEFAIEYFDNILFGLVLIIIIGIYPIAFNEFGLILSVSICLAGTKLLFQKKYFKYILVIVFASFFHFASIFMIVFILFSIINKKEKNRFLSYIILVIAIFFIPYIVDFITNNFQLYKNYSFRMNSINFTKVLVPLFITIVVLLLRKKISTEKLNILMETNNCSSMIVLNICAVNITLILMSFLNQNIFRFTYFLNSYILLFFSIILNSFSVKDKFFLQIITISICILYLLVTFRNIYLTLPW